VTAQNIPNRLIGAFVVQTFQYRPDPVVTPPPSLLASLTISASTSGLMRGRPGYDRCFEPSNFSAISFRYPR
jgi:hypothetical protein